MNKVKLGKCCPVLEMVLRRDTFGNMKQKGFAIGQMYHLNGKPTRETLVYYFRVAKRDDLTQYGAKSEYAGATYATLKSCPFCGESLE